VATESPAHDFKITFPAVASGSRFANWPADFFSLEIAL
jgi:hypothetical protein